MTSAGLVIDSVSLLQITKSPQQLWSLLPSEFQRNAIQSNNPREALIATLNNINRRESFYQAVVGLGTSGLTKSLHYLGRKIFKRISF